MPTLRLLVIILGLAAFQACAKSCAYESFTWTAREDDNPYFWKSPSFDWNATSTIAVFSSVTDSPDRLEMRDYAQSIGVAVVGAKSPGSIDMHDNDARQQWIEDTIEYVKAEGLNGVNIDYEGHDPRITDAYNSLVIEFCRAMHEAIPGSQVSVDVPVYPEYEGRNYDYKGIAAECDSLFVMAYDAEFWDNVQCAASNVSCSLACASIEVVEFGIQQYLARGVPASSLILGLPWYGLKYEHVAGIPFFTGQLEYQDIVSIVDKAGDAGSITLDEKSQTWIFDCGGKCSQWSDDITDHTDTIWFDDPETLSRKYALAGTYNLKSVGMWEATHVYYDPDYSTLEADEMWNALCQRP